MNMSMADDYGNYSYKIILFDVRQTNAIISHELVTAYFSRSTNT